MPRAEIEDFTGPSYTERSLDISADRVINLYPTVVNAQVRPPKLALIGTPGLTRRYVMPGAGPIRGLYTTANGRAFAVAGAQVHELFAGSTTLLRGTIPLKSTRVSMADNGVHLMLVDGTGGWVFTFVDNTFQPITDPDFPGADFVVFLDQYFVFNIPGTGRFGLTGLLDPFAVDGLDIATAEARPDPLVNLASLHRELRLFGTQTVEPYFDSGNPDFPFEPIPGTVLEQGLVAPDSLQTLGNAYIWLHSNQQGLGKVLTATGYTADVLSTPAQEAHWQTYPRRDDAIAWTYTENGHDFYVLTFPSGNATWVYDLTTGFWHERAHLAFDGSLERHLAQYHCVAFGEHLVGDYRTGVIYKLDEQDYTDDGREIVRVRRFPHTRAGRQRVFHRELEIHLEQGTTPGYSSPQFDTIVPRFLQLRWSNDGGHTFTQAHWRALGQVGQYSQRAYWQKLGWARDRVYEVRTTAAAPVRWVGAFLSADAGSH